ncbi:MAG: class I SAM-dependent methyltransferase [Candidatus Aminicenantes bacterium]|nr:class I SAM-dependent methyltransferase [Candidatus Aminicenantes bacterium]
MKRNSGSEKESSLFLEHTDCPVCGSRSIHLHKKGTRSIHAIQPEMVKITDSSYGEVWDLWKCGSCGHLFANPFPAPKHITSLYGASEDPLYHEEAPGRSKNFVPILNRLDRLRPEKGRLLDVGAATGILLRIAKERGWTPEGVEPSRWCVRFAADTYGLNLLEGDFFTVPLEENAYSAVTMVDFIEHIPHPFLTVEKAAQILEPGGVLCLVTPDIHSFTSRILGQKWWHLRPAHLAYFSRATIRILLERAGFTILSVRRYAWTFSLHYLLSRLKLLSFLLKIPRLGSFWKKISVKLALGDSLEVYAKKK